MKISVVVINYKTFELTKNTIMSVLKYEKSGDVEIILIDNGSDFECVQDLHQLEKEFPERVKFYYNEKNLGFSKANNQGIEMSSGQYIVLLNSDTELTEASITNAVDYLGTHQEIGAIGCRIITPDGKLDHGCKRGFPTPKASFNYFLKLDKLLRRPELDLYKLSFLNEFEINEVDVISGAFMVVPKSVIEKVGKLDERFFMYGEDVDWCYRIKESGYKILYNPHLGNILHFKGASGKKRRFKTIFNFYEAMIIFYNKHFLRKYNLVVTLFVYFGITIQFVIKLSKNIIIPSQK